MIPGDIVVLIMSEAKTLWMTRLNDLDDRTNFHTLPKEMFLVLAVLVMFDDTTDPVSEEPELLLLGSRGHGWSPAKTWKRVTS